MPRSFRRCLSCVALRRVDAAVSRAYFFFCFAGAGAGAGGIVMASKLNYVTSDLAEHEIHVAMI